jgi:hypothetical protein
MILQGEKRTNKKPKKPKKPKDILKAQYASETFFYIPSERANMNLIMLK